MQEGHEKATKLLIDTGCRAEMILGAVERERERREVTAAAFLGQKVTFTDDAIVDSEGEAVMMGWEAPLMEAHAEALCVTDGHVLNVGYGMGLIDAAIARRHPKSHTIIEAHPQIYQKMIEAGWGDRPGVKIIHARWQDAVMKLSGFDSIFFDTYGEHYTDLRQFQSHLPRLLNPDGVYSFFNGLAPDNAFFHAVYCEIVKLELSSIGLTTRYVPLPVDVREDEIWKHVQHRYWHHGVYHLPFAQLESPGGARD